MSLSLKFTLEVQFEVQPLKAKEERSWPYYV